MEPDAIVMETPRLRAFRVPSPSATLVVTFSNYVEGGERHQPFGERFFAHHGIDAIHVVAKDNHWFDLPETAALLAAIRDAAGGKPLLTYGSSMGGYAAIRFAAALGAARAIAISPQYALDRRIVPFERRWRHEARRLRLAATRAEPDAPPAIVFFDPHNPDARHVEHWARERVVEAVPLAYAGHPAATFLAQVGLLGESLLAIVDGRFDAAATVREARARRRRSGQYFTQLAAAQPVHRRRCALAIVGRAIAISPQSADYRGIHAVLLYRAGREAEAEAAHRAALALAPDDPLAWFRLSRFLQRIGRHAEALAPAEAALRADPGSAALRRHRREVLNALAAPPNPLRPWARTINRLRHLHNRLGWARGWPALDRLARP